MGRDLAPLEIEVDEATRSGMLLGHGQGDVDGQGRRAGTALGAEEDDHAAAGRPEARPDRAGCVAAPTQAHQQGLDLGLQLGAVEGLDDDVVGAGFDERDALLDVVTLGDRQDEVLRASGRRARGEHVQAGDEPVGRRGVGQVDHHQGVVRRHGGHVVRLLDDGHGMTGGFEGGPDQVGRLRRRAPGAGWRRRATKDLTVGSGRERRPV